MPVPLWTRPRHRATGSRASIRLLAFAEAPLADDVKFFMHQYGAPSPESVRALDIRQIAWEDDPPWFDNWRIGAVKTIAEMQLPDVGRLDAARYCFSVEAEQDDPPDHVILQAAWAVARWHVERGCSVVFDPDAARWHDAARVAALAPDRPFNLDNEIGLIIETTPRKEFGGRGHALHTRGMVKFARPDVMVAATPETAERLTQIVREVAQWMADGEMPTPGQGLDVNDEHEFFFVPLEPGVNAPQVNLNNDAFLLVPA
jgi:hypothetical protein